MIDTAAKRQSAIAAGRRLPWFRRFTIPAPDGTIDQADRQTLGFCYGGILAGSPVVTPAGRLEYTIPYSLLQYTVPDERLQFTVREQ